jgi:hypothetical protein
MDSIYEYTNVSSVENDYYEDNSSISEQASKLRYDEKELCDLLKRILAPILLVLGTLGNLISIFIFSTNKSMRRQITFRYMINLSIFDLLVLSFGYGHTAILVYTNVDVRLLNNAMCKAHTFLVHFFSQSSSLVLVCMSVDRTISIVNAK